MTQTQHRLIAFAEQQFVIKMFEVEQMTDGCVLLTDSGGRKLYVAGRLDNGKPFAVKC